MFNFLCHVLGLSDDFFATENYLEISEDLALKVLALAYNMVYVQSKGKKRTYKSLAQGTAVKKHSDSAQLLDMLNGYGHCCSTWTVNGLESAIATVNSRENKNLPPTILQNIFATMVWDNGDFEEETLSGAGSTHVSHGICLQNQEVAQPEVNQPVHNIKKSTRSIKCTEENIPDFFQQKKVSPNLQNAASDLKMEPNTSIVQSQFRRFDLAFVLIKLSLWLECADINYPAWTGFNLSLIHI